MELYASRQLEVTNECIVFTISGDIFLVGWNTEEDIYRVMFRDIR